jgi:hypothetical protein
MQGNGRDYSKSKIYKIIDNTTQKIYIGSTLKSLSGRLSQHKSDYKRYLNGRFRYITSFEILKNENYNIILIENCINVTNIELLRSRERYYIETLECVNKTIPGRNKKEYYQNNKKEIIIKRKQYYEENKEATLIQKKKYRQDNKQTIQIKDKQRYQEKQNEKFDCFCGGKFTLQHRAKHQQTKKHLNHLKNNK